MIADGLHARADGLTSLAVLMGAEADVTVSQDPTLTEAHLAHRAEDHLLAYVPRLTAATIHVSPADAHEPSAELP